MYCADPLWAHMTTNEGVLKVRRKRILISERALALVRALFISVSNTLLNTFVLFILYCTIARAFPVRRSICKPVFARSTM
jgi:hypothetical protein